MSPTARMMTSVKLGLMAAILAIAVPGTAAAAGTNGKLVFASDRDAGDVEIYSMNADGRGQTRLTTSPGDDTYPLWSPSGTRIAFSSARNGNNHIFTMSAGGAGQTQITDGAGFDVEPTWSPDGSRIAYASDTGNFQIFVVNADGMGPVQPLTNTVGSNNVDPVCSVQSEKTVFTGSLDGNEDIWVMDAADVNQRPLTTDAARDYGPYWSPDGSQIAFQSERDGNSEIYVMDANGDKQTRLTNDPAVDSSPAWSPDGSKIAFHSNRDGDFEIYTVDPQPGAVPAQLTTNLALDKFPDWQPAQTGGIDSDPPSLSLPPD